MKSMIVSRLARNLFFVAVLLLLLAVMVMPVYQWVQFKMLPKNNTNTFVVTVDMPEATTLEETDYVTRRIGDIVRQYPQVETWETSVGHPGVVDFNGLLRGSGLKQEQTWPKCVLICWINISETNLRLILH